MDVFVEPTGMYLRRASAVSAHTPLEAIDSYESKTQNTLSRRYCLEKNVIEPSFEG
ncbi:hypothetical protein TUM4433_01660 [Shewanella schlegeliana]|nr:hypothetical protein TUM4433_01660 [Shewanella schlegeliana]